ncbi:hypothetical protein [Pseudomonas sp.]|uniref:hypothetical protein n=1 Tax=Pseudomonas sp. TaxID=306 RepID=UPI00261007DF|nr:hypothetical protein [Pseudomonas sp.]
MNVSKMDKVLLGITVVIVTVAAATIHMWLAFLVLPTSVAAAVALTRYLAAQRVRAVNATVGEDPTTPAQIESASINPATGLPMAGSVDVRGNLFGQNEAFGTNIFGRHDD